jgi:hypothetical protein
MLNRGQTFKPSGETTMTVGEELTPGRGFVEGFVRELIPFAAVVAQFGLIVLVVQDWQLESVSLSRLLDLAFVGFVIHHLLPLRLRLPFFAGLSLVAVITGVGHLGPNVIAGWIHGTSAISSMRYQLAPGLTLIGIGLGLIGICHLPIRFGARVGLVAVGGAGLAIMRAHSQWFPDIAEMWVILGSMFMFRLMIYLYDLKHRTVPFSPARAISYFFMLPNVCFPLFPVVDYKTFCSTYYNEDWARIYQTGLKWMFRGVIQLLLYRLVYQYAPLDVYKLSSALDVAGCMLGMYLLYLRISGTFHLIIGLLLMFGFNLPETHHLYYLATSFTDFWRRINIYWKEFVMKLFFYPTHFKLRKMGTVGALSVATLVTFVATWLLHSWQWFWIRGKPLFNWKDFSFWIILGVLVLVTAIYETTWGRKRTLTPSRLTLSRRLVLGLEAGAVFLLMCILWSFWTCQSWAEFQTLMDAASKPTWRDIAIILAVFAIVCVSGMLWGRSSRETSEGRSTTATSGPFHFWHSAIAVTAGSICLLAGPLVATWTIPSTKGLIARIHNDVLNARDMTQQRRGYYEELDVGQMDNRRWRQAKMAQVGQAGQLATRWGEAEMSDGWDDGKKVFYRDRSDFLLREIVPSVSTILGGAPITSNRLGMRDREYQKAKPKNTYRMVLLGSSHEQGTGVKEDKTYENLVENSFNRELPDPRFARYEILNLSVGGYSVLQRLLRLEQEGFEYQPDVALLSMGAVDGQFLVEHLRKALTRGIVPPVGYRELLEHVAREAGVHGGMPNVMIERRLLRYVTEINEWAFRRFAQQCAQRGVRPLVIYRPGPIDFEGLEPTGRREVLRLARAAGLEVIDLSPAFNSVADRGQLVLAEWDHHTNALGHRLLAEKLYEGLAPLLRTRSPITSSSDKYLLP